MTLQDAAIADLVTNHRTLISAVILDETKRDRRGCLQWTGRRTTDGAAAYRHMDQTLRVHRIVYALERGIEHLPGGRSTRGNVNGPCVAQVCLEKLCVESKHLARMRRRDIGYDPLYPGGELLPEEPRFRAENLRRQGIVPGSQTQIVYDLDSDAHSALLLELRLLDPEVARGRFAAAERQVAQAATA